MGQKGRGTRITSIIIIMIMSITGNNNDNNSCSLKITRDGKVERIQTEPVDGKVVCHYIYVSLLSFTSALSFLFFF